MREGRCVGRRNALVVTVAAASYLRVAFFAAGSAVKDEVAAIMAATIMAVTVEVLRRAPRRVGVME